jgi:biotin transport system substrate-specific component
MKVLATETSSAVPIHRLLALLRNKKVTAAFQILCASLFIGLTAQIKIPLPFTPVPLVGTTFGVILVSALLGSRKAALAAFCYLVEGSIGLPVWAGGAAGLAHLMGPTGGYRFAYPLQAFLIGYSMEKIPFSFPKTLTALFLISCLQLTIGSFWLAPFVGFNHCFLLGLVPFIGIEFFKVLITTIYLKVKKS